jgi:hypothetical protein
VRLRFGDLLRLVTVLSVLADQGVRRRVRIGASARASVAECVAAVGSGGIGAPEAVEDVGQLLSADAGAGIRDSDDYDIAVSAGGQVHAAAVRSVSQSVGDEVLDRLAQPHRIGG